MFIICICRKKIEKPIDFNENKRNIVTIWINPCLSNEKSQKLSGSKKLNKN